LHIKFQGGAPRAALEPFMSSISIVFVGAEGQMAEPLVGTPEDHVAADQFWLALTVGVV